MKYMDDKKSERFVLLDGAVVGVVDLVGLQRAEEGSDVVDTAPGKPEAGDDSDENGKADRGDVPEADPRRVRPRMNP